MNHTFKGFLSVEIWFQWWLILSATDEKDIDVDGDKSDKDEDADDHNDEDAVGKIKIKWS